MYYVKVLKREGEDEWMRNVQASASTFPFLLSSVSLAHTLGAERAREQTQLTFWIFACLLAERVMQRFRAVAAGAVAAPWISLDGFTPAVWLIVALKALNCLIIPACLKYGDNILYNYKTPGTVGLTALLTALATGILPSTPFIGGVLMVFYSLELYTR